VCGGRPGMVTVRRRELAAAAEPCGEATAAWPAGLACLRLSPAR